MGKKILIVDDHKKNRKLTRVILQSNGYETIEAEDGKSGVQMAKENIPALILMDIQMPEMNGLEAMNILKSEESTRNIPIIALTSSVMKGDRESFMDEGFDDYISQPIDIVKFIEIIKKYI